MGFRDSLFGKKRDGETPLHTTPSETASGLVSACRSVPFLASLQVSPNEDLVCCVTPDGVAVAYEPGSDRAKWSLSQRGSALRSCRFVGIDRVLAVSDGPRGSTTAPAVLLVDTNDGRVLAKATAPRTVYSADSDPRTGLYVGGGVFDIITIQTAGDRLEMSLFKSSQVDLPGPKIGPDGRRYFISTWRLYRIEGDEATAVMDACHSIYSDPPAKIYCGGGSHDRSGASALNILDLETGSSAAVPWGREPVSEIFPAGPDHLLIGSETDIWGKYPSVVTSFSLADSTKRWSLTIEGLPQMRPVILETAPAEGWALIQRRTSLDLVALDDGRTLHSLRRESQHFAAAKWLGSKQLLYMAGNPVKEHVGLMECYRVSD
jgi:hypothetical protein